MNINELAETQNVKPLADLKALFGARSDREDDGFEEAIEKIVNKLRHRDMAKTELEIINALTKE